MEKELFERAIKQAVAAPAMSGTKWRALEELFAEEGLRGSGALNNQPAERRTRIRQLFTTRRHRGYEEYDYSHHAVFVINHDAARQQRRQQEQGERIGNTYLDLARADILAERPPFEPGHGTRSVLILRFDPEPEPLRMEGEPEEAEQEGREHIAQGTLTPLLLLVWEEDDVIRSYLQWYPGMPVERFEPPQRAAVGEAWVNVALQPGELMLPSEDEEKPLIGLDEPFERAVAALRAGKHVILYGPPGTGKTELAEMICARLIAEPRNHFLFTTATSDWTTFDTIGGYVPAPGAGAHFVLDFQPGIVTRALQSGKWLIIDEINRADVDKAFGELFTLLSGKSVRLPYRVRVGDEYKDVVLGDLNREDHYGIPMGSEWRLIGTLNTFDKASLYQLSYAFMRRFAFVEVACPPRDDYVRIIRGAVEQELEGESQEVQEIVQSLLAAVFAPEPNEGLARLELLVGPAIPLDIIRYCRGRLVSAHAHAGEPGNVVRDFVREGIESFLYPQFEGRDRDHELIIEAISDALELDEDRRGKTNRQLALWTGADLRA